MTEARTADIVIVGGGIAGLSLAAHVVGQGRVIVLEAEMQAGHHATGRSAAVLVPNYGGALVRELTALGRAAFDDPDPEFFTGPVLVPRGLLRIVRPDGRRLYDAAMADAPGIEPMTLHEAARLFPPMRPERFVAASFESDVHDIDVDALLQGYARMARTGGAEIMFDQEVLRIERQGGAWRVATKTETFEAPILVNAAGAWSDHIAGLAGLAPVGLKPCRRSIALLPLPDGVTADTRWPITIPFPLGWYAKTESGRLLVSAAEEVEVAPQDVMVDDLALAEGLHRFEEDTTVAVRRVEASWAGLRTFAPDGAPVIGFDPLSDGFFWFAGQGGFGIQTAPGLAALGGSLLAGKSLRPDLVSQIDIARLR